MREVRSMPEGEVYAETQVLVALLDDDYPEAMRLIKTFHRSELRLLRQSFFDGISMIDETLKVGDHA